MQTPYKLDKSIKIGDVLISYSDNRHVVKVIDINIEQDKIKVECIKGRCNPLCISYDKNERYYSRDRIWFNFSGYMESGKYYVETELSKILYG